jgi:hypothetical protein
MVDVCSYGVNVGAVACRCCCLLKNELFHEKTKQPIAIKIQSESAPPLARQRDYISHLLGNEIISPKKYPQIIIEIESENKTNQII